MKVNWDRVAMCESGGRWDLHVGRFDGGLQFLPATWTGHGGGQYAPRAYQASREQQISIAERVRASQGMGAWPVCGRHAHDTTVTAPPSTPAGTYVVAPGDTLSSIATAQAVPGGWQALWQANRDTVPDPDRITVGQRLRIPH